MQGGPGGPGVRFKTDFKVLGGGKGEVKPPKCPTRHPRVGGYYTYMYVCVYIYMCIVKPITQHPVLCAESCQ